jgi:hypothetical protein
VLADRVDPSLLGDDDLARWLVGELLHLELAGVVPGAPLLLMMVAPKQGFEDVGFAALVEVADAETLAQVAKAAGFTVRTRDGFALIGPPVLMDAAEDFAFAHMRATPDHSELIIYPKLLEALVSDKAERDVSAWPAPPTALGMVLWSQFPILFDQGRAFVDQIDRVHLSLARDADSSDLFVHVYPQPGTALETFIAAQTPSDFALLGDIPGQGWPDYIIVGAVELGPARAPLIDVLAQDNTNHFGASRAPQPWSELFADWLATLTGEIAMAQIIRPYGPSAQGAILLGSHDGAASQIGWRSLRAAQGPGQLGIPSKLEIELDAESYDEVMIDKATRVSLPGGEIPAGEVLLVNHTAGFDQRWTFVDPQPLTVAKVINAVRGRGDRPTLDSTHALAPVLADSRALGESLLAWVHLSEALNVAGLPLQAEALTIGFGRHGDALSIHFGLR